MQQRNTKNEQASFPQWNELYADLQGETLSHLSLYDLTLFSLTSRRNRLDHVNDIFPRRLLNELVNYLCQQGLVLTVNQITRENLGLGLNSSGFLVAPANLLIIKELLHYVQIEYLSDKDKERFDEWLASNDIQSINYVAFWKIAFYKFILNCGIELEEAERKLLDLTDDNVELIKQYFQNPYEQSNCKAICEYLTNSGFKALATSLDEWLRCTKFRRLSPENEALAQAKLSDRMKAIELIVDGYEPDAGLKILKKDLCLLWGESHLVDKRALTRLYQLVSEMNKQECDYLCNNNECRPHPLTINAYVRSIPFFSALNRFIQIEGHRKFIVFLNKQNPQDDLNRVMFFMLFWYMHMYKQKNELSFIAGYFSIEIYDALCKCFNLFQLVCSDKPIGSVVSPSVFILILTNLMQLSMSDKKKVMNFLK